MKTNIVMGIYPNTKGFGYAFFESATKPILCGMVVVRPVNNKECTSRIDKLVNHFGPQTIVLRQLDRRKYKGDRIKKLLSKIKVKYTDKIPVSQYSRTKIRNVFKHFDAENKYEIACLIARWLPQYKHKLPRQRKPWHAESYSQGMFDAMSLVLTFYYIRE